MANSEVVVDVKVNADGTTKGLKIAVTDVANAAELIRESLAKIAASSAKAREAQDGLTEKMRDFKSEATQNSRVAKFFANDLAAIIPGADGAAASMKQLIGIGLSGATPFAAVELGIFVFEKLNEKIKESEVEARKLSEAYRATANSISDAMDGIERSLHPVTSAHAAWIAQVIRVRDENRKADEQIQQLLVHAGGFWDLVAAFDGLANEQARSVKGTDQLIAKINEEKEARLAALEAGKPKAEQTDSDERAKKEKETSLRIANERESISVSMHAHLREYAAIGASQEEQIEFALASKLEKLQADAHAAIRDNKLKNEKEADAKIKEMNNAALADKLALLKEEGRLEAEAAKYKIEVARRAIATQTADETSANTNRKYAEKQKALEALAALEMKDAERSAGFEQRKLAQQIQAIRDEADQEAVLANTARQAGLISEQKFQDELAKIRRRADADEQAASEKMIEHKAKEYEKYFAPLKNALAGAFTGLIEGTENISKVLDNLWKGIAKSAIDSLVSIALSFAAEKVAETVLGKKANVSATQGNIATAASGAAAAMASIPIIGPGLALGAAGSMTAFLEGLTSPMLSAAGGYDIPAGLNPVVQTHAREMILPARYADMIRGMTGNGGTSGGSVNVTIHAMDGASVQRVVESPAFANAIREARRNGASL